MDEGRGGVPASTAPHGGDRRRSRPEAKLEQAARSSPSACARTGSTIPDPDADGRAASIRPRRQRPATAAARPQTGRCEKAAPAGLASARPTEAAARPRRPRWSAARPCVAARRRGRAPRVGFGGRPAPAAGRRPTAAGHRPGDPADAAATPTTVDGDARLRRHDHASPAGAGTVTWLPPSRRRRSRRGEPLYRVDDDAGRAAVRRAAAVPDAAAGVEGPDVAQLESNLAALGYAGFTVDDEYTAAPPTAVRRWQEDLGLPETGRVEPGRVVVRPGRVRVDERHGRRRASRPGPARRC